MWTLSGILDENHWFLGRMVVYSYFSYESSSGMSFGMTFVVAWVGAGVVSSVAKSAGSVKIEILGGSCGIVVLSLWTLRDDLGDTPRRKSQA